MGIIGYIKRERERRFRLAALDKVMSPSNTTASVAWRFVDGDDKALDELSEYKDFVKWRTEMEFTRRHGGK